MKTITLDKSELLAAYRAGNADQKEMLEHLFGKDVFAPNWREITSYEKACEVLGIEPIEINEVGNRHQYMRMANAMQQLLVICEAVNGNGKWYNDSGFCYYPVFDLFSKEDIIDLGEADCKRIGIRKLLYYANAYNSDVAGVRCASPNNRSANTIAFFGFPMRLNSKEKAEFVGKQFFELCCACYGLTLQRSNEKQ